MQLLHRASILFRDHAYLITARINDHVPKQSERSSLALPVIDFPADTAVRLIAGQRLSDLHAFRRRHRASDRYQISDAVRITVYRRYVTVRNLILSQNLSALGIN